eukprot:c28398_g1_i5 orf=883-2325(+)
MASLFTIVIAAVCTCGAVILAIWHIYMHLTNYTEPTYQRYIVRIIFMVPVFAMMSFLSLIMKNKSIYFSSIRDIYEAWVIYNFLSLCLAWVGGPGAVVTGLSGRVLKPSCYLMTCCLPAIPLDGRFIRHCKQGGLQFVILKPILVAVTFFLFARGKYEDGNFSAKQGYLYVTIIYTISYSLALYALVLFYVACKDLLRPFRPVPKFVIIKSVVFLTYWQGVLVFLAAKSGLIKDADEAADVQNFIICIEMAIAAVGHLYAFPFKEYAEANIGSSGGLAGSIIHALNFNDVYYDTVHQFAPTYHDYVLYSDGSQETFQKYRVRTFVPTGQEMETLRKHKHMFGAGKVDDAHSSGFTSSSGGSPANQGAGKKATKETELVENPLLFDPHNPFSQVYDMSPLDAPSSKPALPPLSGREPNDFDPRGSFAFGFESMDRWNGSGEGDLKNTSVAPDRQKPSRGVLGDGVDSYVKQDHHGDSYIRR